MSDLYEELKKRSLEVIEKNNLTSKNVKIKARALSPEEAIGNPEGSDFPIQKGKEKLMQASFFNALGQAFTDRYGDYEGTLGEVLQMPLTNNYKRAIFISTLNAVLRHLHMLNKTVHCRDSQPEQCASELIQYIKKRYGDVKIAQVGFQPRMVESLASEFSLRVLDLDPDNIGTKKFQVTIESPDNTEDIIEWADLLLVTGTTLVNNTIGRFMGEKPVLFYGTTIAGSASLMNWEHFCPCST